MWTSQARRLTVFLLCTFNLEVLHVLGAYRRPNLNDEGADNLSNNFNSLSLGSSESATNSHQVDPAFTFQAHVSGSDVSTQRSNRRSRRLHNREGPVSRDPPQPGPSTSTTTMSNNRDRRILLSFNFGSQSFWAYSRPIPGLPGHTNVNINPQAVRIAELQTYGYIPHSLLENQSSNEITLEAALQSQKITGPQQMPPETLPKITLKRLKPGDTKCVICLQEFQAPRWDAERKSFAIDMIAPPGGCDHYYHEKCIKFWLETQAGNGCDPTCPVCRKGQEGTVCTTTTEQVHQLIRRVITGAWQDTMREYGLSVGDHPSIRFFRVDE